MKAPHNRRSTRLSGHDYTQPGAYFVTICTSGRISSLGRIDADGFKVSRIGEVVLACWQAIPRHFENVELDSHVMMPNHLHAVVLLLDGGRGTPWRAPTHSAEEVFGRPKPGSLSTIVRQFKAASTHALRKDGLLKARTLWQRGFYDHPIRNEADLRRIRAYIEANPARWAEDEYFASS